MNNTPTIVLSAQEQELFAHLLSLNTKHNLGQTIRICGGWVRDKLLEKSSHDIDITLDGMTGQQFCLAAGIPSHLVGANPEQSKHLETAIVQLCGYTVEIVNLRSEDYANGSRIPTVKFGTPQEDALRRDLTVNAMFYNLNTSQIEDYCDGLRDLGMQRRGDGSWDTKFGGIMLCTPCVAKLTFMEDPLRILRVFRFYAKLEGSLIASEVFKGMENPEVQKAFREKVSPERIAIELIGKQEKDEFKLGILNFHDGIASILDMYDVGLLDIIIDVPQMKGFLPFDMDQHTQYHKHNVIRHTTELMRKLWGHRHFLSLPPRRQSLLMFAALLHDLGKRDPNATQFKMVNGQFTGQRSYKGHDHSSAKVARAICNKLKMSDEDTTYVVSVVEAHMRPHGDNWGSDRVLRRFRHDLPDCWEDVIVHSWADMLAGGRDGDELAASSAEYERMLARGRELIELDRTACDTRKPIVSGLKVMEMIPELSPKTGFIKDVNAALLEIRLERPETTEAEYLAKIEQMKPALLAKHSKPVEQ